MKQLLEAPALAGPIESIPVRPAVTETISVVLPCLNEALSVALSVREAIEALTAAGLDGEVIVVDNGSTDESATIAAAEGARVVFEQRPGYGQALKTGVAHARGSIVVMADCDNTYNLSQLPQLIEPVLKDQADLVLGCRLESATRTSMPFLHRYVGTPVLSYLVRRASGSLPVRDSQSGFRAFRRKTLLGLGLRSGGMEFASEMLIRAAEEGLRITEISTTYRPRIGESKLDTVGDGWRHLRLILLLAPHLLLFGPGVMFFLAGLGLSILALFSPAGLEIGSLRWQPVFFSTIAISLGLDMAIGGMVLAYRSSLVAKSARRKFGFVGQRGFPALCIRVGVAAAFIGLAIDGYLFFLTVSASHPLSPGSAVAAAAQSLLIAGFSLATLGFLIGSWHWNGTMHAPVPEATPLPVGEPQLRL
jgi:glycosyltransferase involved in cell wall biosynthesis